MNVPNRALDLTHTYVFLCKYHYTCIKMTKIILTSKTTGHNRKISIHFLPTSKLYEDYRNATNSELSISSLKIKLCIKSVSLSSNRLTCHKSALIIKLGNTIKLSIIRTFNFEWLTRISWLKVISAWWY